VASSSDIVNLYRGEMRRKLTAVERSGQQREVWRSVYQWPLGFGLMALLLGAWVGDGRRGLAAAAGAVLAMGLALQPATALAGTLADADGLYQQGRFDEAADALTELSLEAPDDSGLLRRLGAARYRAGDFEGAARAWDQAVSAGDGVTSAFNAGNAHWNAGRLEEAAQRYADVLERDPEHEGARFNSELLAQELELRRQPPPPPPPQGGEGEESEEEQEGSEDQQEQPEGAEGQPQDQEGDSDQADPSDEAPENPAGGEPLPELDDVEEGESPEDMQPGESAPGMADETGEPITAGQADRLLDSIEEGTQRIRVSGKPGEKPW
jgi:Ca-activated chloride channel family protein